MGVSQDYHPSRRSSYISNAASPIRSHTHQRVSIIHPSCSSFSICNHQTVLPRVLHSHRLPLAPIDYVQSTTFAARRGVVEWRIRKKENEKCVWIMHPSTHSYLKRGCTAENFFLFFSFSSIICCISVLQSNCPVMKPSSRHQSFMPSFCIMYPNFCSKPCLKDAVCASMQQSLCISAEI